MRAVCANPSQFERSKLVRCQIRVHRKATHLTNVCTVRHTFRSKYLCRFSSLFISSIFIPPLLILYGRNVYQPTTHNRTDTTLNKNVSNSSITTTNAQRTTTNRPVHVGCLRLCVCPPVYLCACVCLYRNRNPNPPPKGVSHLASTRIVGNKGYPRRGQSLFKGGKVQNDVNLLSYYLKNRKAAAANESAPLNLASGTTNESLCMRDNGLIYLYLF